MKTLEEIFKLTKLNIIEIIDADEEELLGKGFKKNENSFVLTNQNNFDLIKIYKDNFNNNEDLFLYGFKISCLNDIKNLINNLNKYFKSHNQYFEEGKVYEQNFSYNNKYFDIGINISAINQINIRISKNTI
jgi:hypothetical protein